MPLYGVSRAWVNIRLSRLQNPEPAAPIPVLSVSQLNRQARQLLEGHFGFVRVEGEVSNFMAAASGHWYFSLKDGGAQVRCAMFRNRNQRVRQRPANGDAVRLRCRVTLYEARGEFQLVIEHLEAAGAGALQARFEALKAKLLAEGLFAPERKQPLPPTIRRLGIITSARGAAIHDVLTVLARRCPSIAIDILPVAVQGDAAGEQISAAIAQANRWHRDGKIPLDALLVTRGGGSLEDLWAFNEEVVARAIAASELPIVSAVGHEVDFTIADMVADQRAPTPSAAAELLSPDQEETKRRLVALETMLQRRILARLSILNTGIIQLRKRLKHPGFQLRERAQRLDDLEQRLHRSQQGRLRQQRQHLALLERQLKTHAPGLRVQQLDRRYRDLEQRLQQAIGNRLVGARARLTQLDRVLGSLSPLRVLERGYAIVSHGELGVIQDSDQLQSGDRVQARLARGSLDLTVNTVHKAE